MLLVAAGAPVAADPCASWEGEPDPLPRVDGPDPLHAQWAALRIEELEAAARRLEPYAPGRAGRLWRRVLCMDPNHAEALLGRDRNPSVTVHRPPLVNRVAPGGPTDPYAALDHPLRLYRPARRAAAPERRPLRVVAPGTPPARPALEKVLGEAETHLRAARFEATLESADAGRRLPGASTDSTNAAKLEVVAATASLALGRTDDAEAAFVRALRANPGLRLDPQSTPPKVRRAFERVRDTRRGR